MASLRGFRKLEVWQLAMNLVEDCYRVTRVFPDNELFGLTSQLRRAAVSIPSNVAEGACRRKTKVFLNHVSIALGSTWRGRDVHRARLPARISEDEGA